MKSEPLRDYNTVHLMELDDSKIEKINMWMASKMGHELVKHYPNLDWAVAVDIENQVIEIACPDVSKTHSYRVHVRRRTMHDLCGLMKKVGGEILERGNIPRAFNTPEKVESVSRDVFDNVIGLDNTDERPI